jgi:cytochrome c biogenesis protein CcdA/thiol-disulfide isomerase/thioredoxin
VIVLCLIGLLAGVIAGISPCILPILPIVFVGWTIPVDDDPAAFRHRRRRDVAVVAGLVVGFSLTILVSVTVLSALGLPQDLFRWLALIVLTVFGIGLIIPAVGHLMERPFARLTRRPPKSSTPGFLLGLGLGGVFAPCAGPVLTAVTTLGTANRLSFDTVILTIFFAIGAAIPLLAIALAGDELLARNRSLGQKARKWRPAGGVLLILMVFAIQFSWLDGLQRFVPDYTTALQSSVEGNGYATSHLNALTHHSTTGTTTPSDVDDGQPSNCMAGNATLEKCGVAPNFAQITAWLNTPGDAPLTMSSLRGKVVLIDFWTYSCINCQRTLPHVEAWYARYHAYGLDVIGVQSPEFGFEHVVSNVRSAASALGVTYPIAVDNQLGTWFAYNNEYWPAEYLVDANGVIRHEDFGEGDYRLTEKLIRQLLVAANPSVTLPPPTDVANKTPTSDQSPETYLGINESQYNSGVGYVDDVTAYYQPNASPQDFTYALGGSWDAKNEDIVSSNGATLALNYLAQDVYLVMGGSGTVTVTVDHHSHVVTVSGYPRLYTLISSSHSQQTIVHLSFSPGVAAYDFTFG